MTTSTGDLIWYTGKYQVPQLQVLESDPILLSDSMVRGDLIALALGEFEEAQREKGVIEGVQRRDRTLRQIALNSQR